MLESSQNLIHFAISDKFLVDSLSALTLGVRTSVTAALVKVCALGCSTQDAALGNYTVMNGFYHDGERDEWDTDLSTWLGHYQEKHFLPLDAWAGCPTPNPLQWCQERPGQ